MTLIREIRFWFFGGVVLDIWSFITIHSHIDNGKTMHKKKTPSGRYESEKFTEHVSTNLLARQASPFFLKGKEHKNRERSKIGPSTNRRQSSPMNAKFCTHAHTHKSRSDRRSLAASPLHVKGNRECWTVFSPREKTRLKHLLIQKWRSNFFWGSFFTIQIPSSLQWTENQIISRVRCYDISLSSYSPATVMYLTHGKAWYPLFSMIFRYRTCTSNWKLWDHPKLPVYMYQLSTEDTHK